MYIVNYEIQGGDLETQVASSYEMIFDNRPGEVPTVRNLIETFPYLGCFHFRAMVPSDLEEYAWLDLTDQDAPVPVWQEDDQAHHIHVKALVLSFDTGELDENLECEELDWSERDLMEYSDAAYPPMGGSFVQADDLNEDDKSSWSKIKEVTDTVLTSDVARDLTKKGKQVGKVVGKQVGKLWSQIKSVASDT